VCDAFVADHALSTPDQHLVLGSAAFWGLVGPPDAALRAHYHEKVGGRSAVCVCVCVWRGGAQIYVYMS
jgi:hypothetical protein